MTNELGPKRFSELSVKNLKILLSASGNAIEILKRKDQNEISRFVYCGVLKLYKIIFSINLIYPCLDKYHELEFSIGISLRSLMMDNLLLLNIVHHICQYRDENPGFEFDDLKEIVRGLCYKIIADGTNNFINDVFNNEKLTEEEKMERYQKFANQFPNAFDMTPIKPKLKKEFRIDLSKMYLESKHPLIVNREEVYDLYSYYSKYDHLSHYTGMSDAIPFERRKGRVDLAILLNLLYLRNLISISFDFQKDTKELENILNYLQESIKLHYDPILSQ